MATQPEKTVVPSGEQVEIAYGDQRAVVVEVGGGLRTYAAGGLDVLDGYGLDEMATAGRGQVLVPWPNRLEDGAYELDGERQQLPLTEPEHGNAIHGLVRWVPWSVSEHHTARAVLEHTLHPQPGYPFALSLAIEYALGDGGLRVTTTATNVGDRACPYGSGAHPYLTLGTPTVDPLVLTVPAATVLRSDDRGIPTGAEPVDGTELDFRQPRTIGASRLDNCFTGLARSGDGTARVELREPESGAGVVLWVDAAHLYVMVFTGDHPDVGRSGLAVEPMTCPPNAFRTGQDLIRLEPGASTTSTWGIRPSS